jgi:hypothetical protein
MVEATVALRNGEVLTVYAGSFEELFANLDAQNYDIVQVVGRTIKLNEMRQGKERLQA